MADDFILINPEAQTLLRPYLLPEEKLLWCARPIKKSFFKLYGTYLIGTFITLFVASLIAYSNCQNSSQSSSASANLSDKNTSTIQSEETLNPTSQKSPQQKVVSFLFIFIFSFIFAAFFVGIFVIWCRIMFMGLLGKKLLDTLRLKNSVYGLTNYRLLVVSGKKKRYLLAQSLQHLPDLCLEVTPHGYGTIAFAQKFNANTNPFIREDVPSLSFRDVPHANRVYGLIFQTQAQHFRTL